jgi:hypothetical protein
LGRDGTLQYERLDHRRREGVGDRWEALGHCPGQSVEVVAGGRTAHIFVSDERGRVSHKLWSSDRWLPSQDDWADLGGGFGGPVVAVADEDGGAAVVAFSEDGRLRARQWRNGGWDSASDAWKPVDIADELAAGR